MSRAFVSESDSQFEDQDVPELKNPLPPGARNYMTPEGAGQLKDELQTLGEERSKIASRVSRRVGHSSAQDKAELGRDRHRLRELERKIEYLTEMIARLEVIDPRQQNSERVVFGATVTVRVLPEDRMRIYQIVGVEESNPTAGKVSWVSPIAKGMLSKRVGDVVTLHLPDRETSLEILKIEYC